MHLYPYASATYTLVVAWSVGTATGVSVADREVGLIRDHPSFGRRLSAQVVPPLAAAGLLMPFLVEGHDAPVPPRWILLSMPLMLLFAVLAWPWSRAWQLRTPALRRRRLGIIAVAAGMTGLAGCTALALGSLHPAWRGVMPLAVIAATATLLGSLTNFSLLAVTAGLPEEVPGGPARGLAELTGAGLLIDLLAGLETGMSWLHRGSGWPHLAVLLWAAWLVGALLVPGSLLLARLYTRHLPDAWLMGLALASAAAGQWLGLLLIFRFPGLVPPLP